jgi:2-polyprenyl-3-methyl-5-hydroxy-6-metoxy-1,4-benzoquinol methylase
MAEPTRDATRYRELVERVGLSETHQRCIDWVPRGARVLELGCSSGFVGARLIVEKGCTVVGAEIDPRAADEARAVGLEVHVGSLEDPAFLAEIDALGPFDVVIAADVLEHLADPPPVLERMKRWIANNGYAIIAVPNVASWNIRSQLFFRGDFEYQDTGTLDRTHLHHFTWFTLHKLVHAQGWKVIETMVDDYELPIGGTLLRGFPDLVLKKWGRLEWTKSMPDFVHKLLAPPATSVAQLRARIEQRLMRHVPNLVANHVALLLSPPAR